MKSTTLTQSSRTHLDLTYWNSTDLRLNLRHRHPPAVYNQQQLQRYYRYYSINSTKLAAISGLKRYIIENEYRPIAKTLQGYAYSAVDIKTGRKVIIKCSNKKLVERRITRKGTLIAEDIRSEAKMCYIATKINEHSDSYISKYVDFFETKTDYFLVVENGGIEFFDFIVANHPQDQNKIELVRSWSHNMRYYFRMLVRAVYYLHVHCHVAHLDISLENTVIDTQNHVVRIIDFGLAKRFQSNNWNYNGFAGKIPYHSPEMRRIHKYLSKHGELDRSLAFDARSADVWALGCMLFVMLAGGRPWDVAENTEDSFCYIMNGDLDLVLQQWQSSQLVCSEAKDLLQNIFKPASQRIDIKGVLNHPYVKYGPRCAYTKGKMKQSSPEINLKVATLGTNMDSNSTATVGHDGSVSPCTDSNDSDSSFP